MICSLSILQQEKFFTKVAKDLLERSAGKSPFDLKSYMQEVHDMVNSKADNPELALAYVQLVPGYVDEVAAFDRDIKKNLREKGISFDDLADLISRFEDEKGGLDNIKEYLSPEKSIDIVAEEATAEKSEQDIQQQKAEERKDTELNQAVDNIVSPPSIPSTLADFIAVKSSAFTDRDQEALEWKDKNSPNYNVKDPVMKFYYDVKTNIRELLRKENGNSDTVMVGRQPGIKLVAMKINALSKEDVGERGNKVYKSVDGAEASLYEREVPVMVLTDGKGNIIRFNEEGKYSEEGKPAYYTMRNIYPSQVKEGKVDLWQSKSGKMDDYQIVESMLRANKGMKRADAINLVREQLQQIYNIHEALKKDPNLKVDLNIDDITEGYVEEDLNVKTPVGQLKTTPNYQYSVAGDDSRGIKKGEVFFTTPETGEKAIIVERPAIRDIEGMQDKIVSLLFDDLTLNDSPITGDSRRKYLEPFLFLTRKDSTNLNADIYINDAGVYTVSLNGKAIYNSATSTPEQKDQAKEMIRNAIVSLQTQGSVTASEHPNAKVIEGTDFDSVKHLMKNGDIFRLKDGNTTVGEYWVGYPKAQLSSANLNTTYTDVNIANGKITPVQKDYRKDYIGNNFSIHYKLSGDNTLSSLNSYFVYSIADKGKVAINTTLGKKIEPVVKPQVTEKSDRKRGLDAALNDPDLLNKIAEQKGIEVKALRSQIEAAAEWYKNHPMAKHIPLNVMFEAVNTQTKNSVATWSRQGITLYKGSDYSDLYHEAWHAFTQVFVSPEERNSVYDETRKLKGTFIDYKGHITSFKSATNLQIEEYLAEEFRKFALSGGKAEIKTPAKRNFFQKIWDYLKAFFNDTTLSEIAAVDNATRAIHEVFEKLHIGAISEPRFQDDTMEFTNLNKGIVAFNPEAKIQDIAYDDSKEIVSMTDALFSEFIDEFSKGARAKTGKNTAKWTSTLLQKPAALKAAYEYTHDKMVEAISSLNENYEALIKEGKQFEADKVLKKMNTLQWAVSEFGDIDNLLNNRPGKGEEVKGLIGYHQLKSSILRHEDKEAFFDTDVQDEADLFLKGREGYDRSGNETSIKELASQEILFLMNSLHKTDKQGNKIYVEGTNIPILENFDKVWNRVVKTLENTLDAEEMFRKLAYLAETAKDLPIRQLLEKMGDIRNHEDQTSSEFNLWTNFWQTFNKARVPLLQTTVEIETVDADGRKYALENVGFRVIPGQATSETKKIRLNWEHTFAAGEGAAAKYQLKDSRGKRYLNLKKLWDDFLSSDWYQISKNNREVDFLRAIGFELDQNNDDIKKAVKDINAKLWYDRLKHLSYRTDTQGNRFIVKIYRVVDLAVKYPETPVYKFNYKQEGEKKVLQATGIKREIGSRALDGEMGNFNAVLSLQAKYSDQWGNFQVSNAKGNTQFEHTLNNTLTVLVNTLNQAQSYKDLISKPWMKHLDIAINPQANVSAWLNSLFDMQEYRNGGLGARRRNNFGKPVVLNMENLSGVAMKRDSVFEDDLAIESANADPVTKMVMDLHMALVKGAPELMRHADKGTSFTIYLNNVYSHVGSNSLYVKLGSFYKEQQKGLSIGEDDAISTYIIPNLEAEIARMIKVRNLSKEIQDTVASLEKAGKTKAEIDDAVFQKFGLIDKNYLETGKGLVTFSDVLSSEAKNRILKEIKDLKPGEKYSLDGETLSLVKNNIFKYFKNETRKFERMMNKAQRKGEPLISDNLYEKLQKEIGDNNLTVEGLKKSQRAIGAIYKAYVYNSWIHNIESLSVIYGDLAQYNMAKEEFHKRNAGASSTGTMYRTDKSAIDFVNKQGSLYAQSKGVNTYSIPTDGTLNTAIVKDNEIPSVYFKEYAKAMIDDLVNKGASQQEAEKKVLGFKGDKIGTYDSPMKGGLAYAYQEMNEGDAQGWITFDAYRALLMLEGAWSDAQEALYKDIIAGKNIKPGDIHYTFPPQKLQYWGSIANSVTPLNAFHKYSLFPLVPNVIQNKTLQDLHDKMVKENIHYVTFKSGSKVSTLTKYSGMDSLYADNQRNLAQDTFAPNKIFLNYLKNQLYIAPKFKEKVIFSTQLRKLVEDGLIENGVPTDFNPAEKNADKRMNDWAKVKDKEKASDNYKLYKTYENNIEKLTLLKKKELLDEMGWKLDQKGNPVGEVSTLVRFIKDELSSEDLAEHELNFIDLGAGGKNLKHDLSLSLSAEKIEKMLNSIVVNRLVRQKVNGEGLIQVSGAGMENKSAWLGAREATAEEKQKWGTNDLPTYYQGADGKTTAMKVKVALQGKFMNLLNLRDSEGKRIGNIDRLNELLKDESWLNTGDHRHMVTMVGVRIPVQGLNSMEFMEVYEFLPENAGNIIIPPAEIVAKSGSDFDVDKLSVFMPVITSIGKDTFLAKHDPSIKESKSEIKSKILELREKKQAIEDQNAADYEALKEAKAFKQFTPEEKDAFNKMISSHSERVNAVKAEIKDLAQKWNQLQKSYVRGSFVPAGYNEVEGELMKQYSILENLQNEFEDTKVQYKNIFSDEKVKAFWKNAQDKTATIDAEINENKRKLVSVGTEGIENEILWNLRNILELKSNFTNLITPNSTDTVKPVADELGEVVSDYNAKERLNPMTDEEAQKFGEKTGTIAGTRVLEIGYNLHKHSSNNIGKQVLGMGAVDNTFNAIFNRIGAYMEPSIPYKDIKGNERSIVQTIYMPHNTVNGNAISMSNLWDKSNENRISDVISQLMNGWVDIAKDAWVFNVQGNKELAPALMFLIQAGVPFKQAVYFVSQPAIREYAEEQRNVKSSFGELMGKGANPKDFRNKALEYMLGRLNISSKNFSLKDPNNMNQLATLQTLSQGAHSLIEGGFSEENLKANIKGGDQAFQRAVFLHFLEIQNMADAVRDVKMRMNFDTTKSSTIFDALNKQQLIDQLKSNARLSSDLSDKILQDSPIKSFYVQPFQSSVWTKLFDLRNHQAINDFMQELMQDKDYRKYIRNTFGDEEMFGNTMRNDLVNFIFQNSLRSFNLDKIDHYKGESLSDMSKFNDKEQVAYLGIGAFFKGGKVYVDKKTLLEQFRSKAFSNSDYTKLGLAKVDPEAFKTPGEYEHFVLEREYLRSLYQGNEELMKGLDYIATKKDIVLSTDMKNGETEEAYSNRINRLTFESFIARKALHNIYNPAGLFKGKDSFADRFLDIKRKYPALELDYAIMSKLNVNSIEIQNGTSPQEYNNLVLTEKLEDTDMMNLLHENIEELANPNVVKVDNAIDNQIISEFFSQLPLVSFIQSGMNTKSAFSLTRIMPTDSFTRIVEKSAKDYTKDLTPKFLQEQFLPAFLTVNDARGKRLRNRFKDYLVNKVDLASAKKRTEEEKQGYHLFISQVLNGPIRRIEDSESLGDKMLGYKFLGANERIIVVREYYDPKALIDYFTPLAAKAGISKASLSDAISSPTAAKIFVTLFGENVTDIKANQGDIISMFEDINNQEVALKQALQDIKHVKGEELTKGLIAYDDQLQNYTLSAKDLNSRNAEILAIANPDKIFVFNDAFNEKPGDAKGLSGDKVFRGIPAEYAANIAGIPSYSNYKLTSKNIIKDVDGQISPEMKQRIDDALDAIEKSGLTPVFSKAGYGQEWLGISEENLSFLETAPAPQTFLYLSKELFNRFGYVNKSFLANQQTRKDAIINIQAEQELTDYEVEEFIKKCK